MMARVHLWIAVALAAAGLVFGAAPLALAEHHEAGENPCGEEANPVRGRGEPVWGGGQPVRRGLRRRELRRRGSRGVSHGGAARAAGRAAR